MSASLGLVACGGALPVLISQACPDARCYSLKDVPHALGDGPQEHRIEKLGALFAAMHADGVTQVVLAGGLARPALDPTAMDSVTLALAPRIMQALQGGDDQVLRLVIAIFEEQGFAVIGAHEVLPDLTVTDAVDADRVTAQNKADATRGMDILSALSPLDIGQGCVVAAGQCLGIETVQGTDALLSFVAQTRGGSGGVFIKAAKRGQDLRVDMPAIGPDTVAAAARAGLAGIAVSRGQVMMLERAATLAALDAEGLFLLPQEP